MNGCFQEEKIYYRAFGLNVVSDFNLPCMGAANGEPEVTIRRCSLPESLPAAFHESPGSIYVTENECYHAFPFPGFYVSRGRLICLSPIFAALDQADQANIIIAAFRHLFFQRGCVCLHASAVNIGGKVVAFTGKKGMGKSTLAAILERKGCELLSDDSCIISFDDSGKPFLLPGLFTQNFSAETLRILDIDKKGLKNNADGQKYVTGVYPAKYEKPLPLERIYYLAVDNNMRKVEIMDVTGYEKPLLLMLNASNMYHIKEAWPKGMFFKKWSDVAANVILKRITRPLNSLSMPDNILNCIIEGGE